jgi:hypothetical protein
VDYLLTFSSSDLELFRREPGYELFLRSVWNHRNNKFRAYLYDLQKKQLPALRKELYDSKRASKRREQELKKEIFQLKLKCKQHEKEYAPQIAMEQKVSALKQQVSALEQQVYDLEADCRQLCATKNGVLKAVREERAASAILDRRNENAIAFLQKQLQQAENNPGPAGDTRKRQRRDPQASAESAGRTSGNSGDVPHTKPQHLTSYLTSHLTSHILPHITSHISHPNRNEMRCL